MKWTVYSSWTRTGICLNTKFEDVGYMWISVVVTYVYRVPKWVKIYYFYFIMGAKFYTVPVSSDGPSLHNFCLSWSYIIENEWNILSIISRNVNSPGKNNACRVLRTISSSCLRSPDVLVGKNSWTSCVVHIAARRLVFLSWARQLRWFIWCCTVILLPCVYTGQGYKRYSTCQGVETVTNCTRPVQRRKTVPPKALKLRGQRRRDPKGIGNGLLNFSINYYYY